VILVVGGFTVSDLATEGSSGRTIATGAGESRPAVQGSAASPGSSSAGPSIAGRQAPSNSAGTGGVTAPSTGTGGSTAVPRLPTGTVGQSARVVARGSLYLTIGRGKLGSVLTTLTQLVAGDGGFVASSQAQIGGSGSTGPSSGTVVLRVPQASFGTMVTQVERVGHATSVSTDSTDVTGQYVDLQARITALQASRQQYLTIMSQATSIGDILAVQSQLDTLQSQIEQLQGQLNVLNDETTYGTLTVTLTEAGHRALPPPRPQSGLARAWHDGIDGFVSGVEWLIRIAGTTLFVLLFVAALVLLGRWAWRAGRRRML
jgi:hypothetical protein